MAEGIAPPSADQRYRLTVTRIVIALTQRELPVRARRSARFSPHNRDTAQACGSSVTVKVSLTSGCYPLRPSGEKNVESIRSLR
jgi:hypothetical protein